MSILLLLAAASLPRPTMPPLDNRDYPFEAMRAGREAIITHEVIVSPTGLPLNCRIVVSGGADFDELTCRSILRRGRYKPALDDQGQPTFGVLRSRSAWTTGSLPRTPPPVLDVTLTIQPVAKMKLPAEVTVVLSVGPDGHVTSCGPAPIAGPAALIQTSCDQARRLPPFPPINFDGQPVSSVRAVTIGFVASGAK